MVGRLDLRRWILGIGNDSPLSKSRQITDGPVLQGRVNRVEDLNLLDNVQESARCRHFSNGRAVGVSKQYRDLASLSG